MAIVIASFDITAKNAQVYCYFSKMNCFRFYRKLLTWTATVSLGDLCLPILWISTFIKYMKHSNLIRMETIKNLQNDRIPKKQTNKQTNKKTSFYVRSFIYLFIHLLIYFFQIPFHFYYQNWYGKQLDVTLPFGVIIISLLNLGTRSNHTDRLMSTFKFWSSRLAFIHSSIILKTGKRSASWMVDKNVK